MVKPTVTEKELTVLQNSATKKDKNYNNIPHCCK